MLDMDNDERYLNKRQMDLEGGDFDEESTFLEPTGAPLLTELSPPKATFRKTENDEDVFYPMLELETEDIITVNKFGVLCNCFYL